MEPVALVVTGPNGKTGVGFVVQYGGVEQLSVAWDKGAPERFIASDLERHGVRIAGSVRISIEVNEEPSGDQQQDDEPGASEEEQQQENDATGETASQEDEASPIQDAQESVDESAR